MEKGRYDKNASHPHSMTLQIGHQLRHRSNRQRGEINIKRDTMKHIITIFKNLGTIVILLFQIAYVATIDYIRPHDKPNKDTKNKTVTKKDVSSNNEPLRDVCWNSEEWRDEVVHERPHYK